MKVLVCGSQYGRYYLDAIRGDGRHTIAALVARGSDRSKETADALGVPLHTSIDDIPPVDLACVAIAGRAGTELATQLLRRGIPVLREPLVADAALEAMWTASREGDAPLHINGHYADFSPGRELVAATRALCSVSQPHYIQVSADAPNLYSTLDLIARALGRLELRLASSSVQTVDQGARVRIGSSHGTINDIPMTIVHGCAWGDDPGSLAASFVGEHVSIAFPRARVVLTEMEGLTLLGANPWAYHSHLRPPASAAPEAVELLVGQGSRVRVLSPPPSGPIDVYMNRLRAIIDSIEALAAHAAGGPEPEHQARSFIRSVVDAYNTLDAVARHEWFDVRPLIRG